MKNVTITIAAIALSSACAFAGVSTNSVTRSTYTEGDAGFTGPTSNTVNGPASGSWTDFTNELSLIDGDLGGSATSYYTSSDVAPGLYSVEMDVRADAFGDGSGFSNFGAQSIFEIGFSVSESTVYNLTGYAGAFGAINGEFSNTTISLMNTDTMTETVLVDYDDGYFSMDIDGSLIAGNYLFTAVSTVSIDRTFENGFGDSNAGTGFTLTVVPAPSSALALLGMGGISCVRRRR